MRINNFFTPILTLLLVLMPMQSISVELKSGLNLLAYPSAVPANLSCNQFITDLGADAIKQIDVSSQQIEDCVTTNFDINTGSGYFVYSPDNHSVDLSGTPDCPLIDLFPGLNLIGVPAPFINMGCYDLLQSIGDNSVVSTVQRYNIETARYETCAYNEQQVALIRGSDFPVQAGIAYLVNMRQTVTNLALNDASLCQSNQPPVINSTPILQSNIDTPYQYQMAAVVGWAIFSAHQNAP